MVRKNGNNIVRADSILGLVSNSGKQLPFVSIIDTANANDYYEIIWSSTSNHTILESAVYDGHPRIPSVILTVNQVG